MSDTRSTDPWQEAVALRRKAFGENHESVGCADCHQPVTPTNYGRWSALWCESCDVKRMDRISKSLKDIAGGMRSELADRA